MTENIEQKPPAARSLAIESPPAGTGSAGTPDETLYALKQQLLGLQETIQEDQTEVDNLKKQQARLETDLKDLQQSSSGIQDVVQAYKQGYNSILAEMKNLEDYYDDEYKDVLEEISETQKTKIDDLVTEVDGRISGLKERLDDLAYIDELQLKSGSVPGGSVQEAEIQYQNAQSGPDGLEKAQRAFDRWTLLQKTVKDNLKTLKDLQKSITDQADQENYKNAYFYFLDFKALLDETAALLKAESADLTPAVLEEKLVQAWNDLAAAKEVLRAAGEGLNEKQVDLNTTRKSLEAAQKGRKDKILEAIGLI
jgi:chromosome segregation ATPase